MKNIELLTDMNKLMTSPVVDVLDAMRETEASTVRLSVGNETQIFAGLVFVRGEATEAVLKAVENIEALAEEQAELIGLLRDLRPNYGDVGTRDIDVIAKRENIDRAIAILEGGIQQGEKQPLVRCAADRDGECAHSDCPQMRDGEPRTSGRHCPLDSEEQRLG
jgi:hypothetical protein